MIGEVSRLDEVIGGKYRIVRFLASGGMGSVYEAQQIIVRRRFAVKFLHPELAVRRELLTRFQREAEAAGALESENVAAALDFGIAADGAPYIVLEYLVGESLEQLREREGPLPVMRAVNLVQQACRGVQAAHAAGIIHRDLKPHNLFVCRRGDGTDLVKVLDFGVAKLEVVERGGAETRTGTVLGTPSYMSPEQARGEKKVDHLSDVYALGAVLYELLSGKKPHPGQSHNAILHHIATQPAIPLAQAFPGLPAELAAVVERTLEDDASRRPASAGELAEALAPWSRAEVWPAPKLEPSAPRHSEPSTTLLAVEGAASAGRQSPLPPVPVSAAPSTDDRRRGGAVVEQRAPVPERGERSRASVFALAAALAVAVVVIFVLARGERTAETPLTAHEKPATTSAERAEPGPRLAPLPASPPAPTLKLVDVTATAQSVEPGPPVKGPAPALTASAGSRATGRPRVQPAGRPPAPAASERPGPEAEFAGPGPVKAPLGNPYE